MEKLVYTSICKNNGLVIFDFLSENDLQNGVRLYEDIGDYCQEIGREGYSTYYKVKSKQSLIANLRVVLSECMAGVLYPILHFESHGDPKRGLYVSTSNEYVGWDEIIQYVSEINQATKNNTIMVLAACYGFEISKYVKINCPCPFNYVIAPANKIQAGHLRDVILPFYKATTQTGDLRKGLSRLGEGLVMFHCGKWFYGTLAKFMIEEFNAAGRQDIVERIVSNKVARHGYKNSGLIKEERAEAKKYVRSLEGFYNHFASDFFHGSPPISYGKFREFVELKRPKQ